MDSQLDKTSTNLLLCPNLEKGHTDISKSIQEFCIHQQQEFPSNILYRVRQVLLEHLTGEVVIRRL